MVEKEKGLGKDCGKNLAALNISFHTALKKAKTESTGEGLLFRLRSLRRVMLQKRSNGIY